MTNLFDHYFRLHHAMDLWRYLQADKARRDKHFRIDVVFDLAASEVGHGAAVQYIATCNEEDLRRTLSTAEANPSMITNMAKSSLGAKWIQQLILSCKPWPRMIWSLTRALFPGAAELMMDRHGGRLIRYCLTRLPCLQKMFIFAAALLHLNTIATSKMGCVSLINIINRAPGGVKEKLLEKIVSSSVCLAQDPYGSFVVQCIFTLGWKDYEERVCWELRNILLQLSTHKSGSYVVEKCLASAGGWLILDALLIHPGLHRIARDKYGNYVVNTALRASKPVLHRRPLEALRENCRSLKRHQYGRHVYKSIVQESNLWWPGLEERYLPIH